MIQQNILFVSSFHELVNTPFSGNINAICWKREGVGDYTEIVNKTVLNDNIIELDEAFISQLNLNEQGQLAREAILNDMQLLKAHGALPNLNIIKCYERDEAKAIIPTDVYSFHVDSSPIPTDTFLCTYYGSPSEILPNDQAIQKVLIPNIREELKKQYGKSEEGFELYLAENCYDLHYQAITNASPISLGVGNLWRLATLHPESKVLPCIHRAPEEKDGQPRLMMIC
jgi:hypothetical protein